MVRDVVDGFTPCGANPVKYLIVLIFDDYSLFPSTSITFLLEFILNGGLVFETPGVQMFGIICIIIFLSKWPLLEP